LHRIASVVAGSFVLLAVGVRTQDLTGPAGFRATAEVVQFDALFLGTTVRRRQGFFTR
jgi:hypothetical protein